MYSEKKFKDTIKKVKDALAMNAQEIMLWNSYISERNSHVVLFYSGKKPFRTDAVSLWGQFPGKGPLKKVGKGFALLGGELFVQQFLNIDVEDVLSTARDLIGLKSETNEVSDENPILLFQNTLSSYFFIFFFQNSTQTHKRIKKAADESKKKGILR